MFVMISTPCGNKHGIFLCSAKFARMPDKTDARSIIHNCFPFGELEETTRTSSYYMDEDYPARPEV